MSEAVQALIDGVSLGGQYALLALGLAIVFSVMHLINFAHGELITIPGYVMLGLYSIGLPWGVFIVGGVLAGVVAALAMERLAFRPVRHAAPTTMLLTSFGLAIVIQSVLASVVSARPKAVPQPDWLTERLAIGDVSIEWYQLFTIVITAAALLALLTFFRRSFLGTAMRAAATDFDAARLMGLNANRVIAAAFAISGGLAGIAAVAYLARLGSVEPTMGLTPVLLAFVAAVIGGIGDLRGAVAGGFALGILEVALRTWLPNDLTGFTPGFIYLLVGALLVFRPRGIFGAEQALRV